MHKELRTGREKRSWVRTLHSDNREADARGRMGPNTQPPALGDPRPPTRCQPSTNLGPPSGGTVSAREKRRPGRKGAGRNARAPRRALTRPLLPEAFDALTGGRRSAAVRAGPVPPYALRRSRGPDGGSRRAVRPAPQWLPPPPIGAAGRRLPDRRGGDPPVALHGRAKPARSHPQEEPLPTEPAPNASALVASSTAIQPEQKNTLGRPPLPLRQHAASQSKQAGGGPKASCPIGCLIRGGSTAPPPNERLGAGRRTAREGIRAGQRRRRCC